MLNGTVCLVLKAYPPPRRNSKIDFKLAYNDPLEVSQNDEPDSVKVLLDLSQFTDEYGQSMANDTVLEV